MRGTPKKTAKPKSSKKGVHVSNLAKMDARHPQPFEGGQAFSYFNDASYTPFLGGNHSYAQNLLEARLLSVTHNACVTTKKDYCGGVGFHDINGQKLDQGIVDWFKAMNLKNQSVTKINKKVFEDKFTWGNVPIELVRFTVNGKKKLFIYAHSFLEWQLGTPDEDDIIPFAIQSKLFRNYTNLSSTDIRKSKKLPIYSPQKTDKDNWFRDKNGAERTLIWYKNEVSGFSYYGLPSAIASLIVQILEYKGARFNLDNLENNLVAACILALKGTISPEETSRIAKEIIDTYTGDGKRGRTVVVASEEGIDDSAFHKMDTKTDGSFNESDDKWSQKIILANQWDSVLAGLIAPSTMGKGSGFLTKIIEHKLRTVIIPEQRDIMDEVWSLIFPIAETWLNLPFSKYELAIKNDVDISGLTDVDITPAVQVNEVRVAKGMQKDPKMEGRYMKAAGPKAGEQSTKGNPSKKGGEDVPA